MAKTKTPKYIVKSPLSYNQKEYAVGQTVELKDEDAEILLIQKVVEQSSSAPADDETAGED